MRIALESLKNFNIDFSALNLDLNLNKAPEEHQKIKIEVKAKWDDDLDAEHENTLAVFQPRKVMPKAEPVNIVNTLKNNKDYFSEIAMNVKLAYLFLFISF